eukprot:TRINITY_DN7677_c0_g1_i1.p1 TRINITY_DN7677_c0_g1~~TRINITY_DN7677_c0_g1_i1.p1  ORF type:complete len:650 (+),score=118.51 TRINITY_DN7677_c0_g1_i1:167-2116(+)
MFATGSSSSSSVAARSSIFGGSIKTESTSSSAAVDTKDKARRGTSVPSSPSSSTIDKLNSSGSSRSTTAALGDSASYSSSPSSSLRASVLSRASEFGGATTAAIATATASTESNDNDNPSNDNNTKEESPLTSPLSRSAPSKSLTRKHSLPAMASTSNVRASLLNAQRAKPLPDAPTSSTRTSDTRATIRGPSGEPMTKKDKKDKVALELLTTEETYVEALNNLFEHYVGPLEKRTDLIESKDLAIVVSNLRQIVLINQELLNVLSTLRQDPGAVDQLGTALNKFMPFLRLYSQYYSNFHTANSHLQKLIANKPALGEWLNSIPEEAKCLDIHAILIQPVQRVPRYKLLLEQLVKYTDDGHPDKPHLEKALRDITVVAAELNKGVDLKEKYDELVLIQKRLSGKVPKNFLEYHRTLIHEGPLTKLCRKSPKIRYFLLFNNMLVYGEPSLLNDLLSTSNEAEGAGAAVKKPDINVHLSIPLFSGYGKMIPIEDSSKAKNAFEVLSKEKSFLLWAETPEEKAVWVAKLEEAAKARASTISLGDKPEGEFFAPKWQNDEESDNCPMCTAKFTTLKRKHHCRKCGALACGKCSENKMDIPGLGTKQRVCFKCYESRNSSSGDSSDNTGETPTSPVAGSRLPTGTGSTRATKNK